MYEPIMPPIAAYRVRANHVLKIEDEFVMVVSTEDVREKRTTTSPGTTIITYTDIDAITTRLETLPLDRCRNVVIYQWTSR